MPRIATLEVSRFEIVLFKAPRHGLQHHPLAVSDIASSVYHSGGVKKYMKMIHFPSPFFLNDATFGTTAAVPAGTEFLCRFLTLDVSGRGIPSSDDVAGHVARTIFPHPIRNLDSCGRFDKKAAS